MHRILPINQVSVTIVVGSMMLKELYDLLMSHFEPKSLVITERFHFYCRSQKSDESVANFVAELRRMARNSEFGTDALKD